MGIGDWMNHTKEQWRVMRKWRLEQGLCPYCGHTRDDQDRAVSRDLCATCARLARAKSVERRQARQAAREAAAPPVVPQRPRLARRRKKHEDRTDALRLQVLDAYGRQCMCCGEEAPSFLSVHHPRADGAQHRRQLRAAHTTFYTWLTAHGFPPDYVLLCKNCHWAAHHLSGGCPHEVARAADPAIMVEEAVSRRLQAAG